MSVSGAVQLNVQLAPFLLAHESTRGSVLDVLARRTWTSVVQHLRRAIDVLQLTGFLVRGVIQNGQFKTPAKTSQIGVRVRDGDGIGLTGNVGLRCGDRYLARARHQAARDTQRTGLGLLLRRTGVTRGWSSREGVNGTSANVVRQQESDKRCEAAGPAREEI
jgi:hypothetical protein